MASKVTLVDIDAPSKAFARALQLIGGIDELNTPEREVLVKVGVFKPQQGQHTTPRVTRAIVESFPKAPRVYLAESDNYRGTATERLQIWQELFSERVVPFSLTDDSETRSMEIAGEEYPLSHILFKPNVLVSTHALRRYKRGTIIKNLLGLLPMRKKAPFHKNMPQVLCDLFEAVGGVDLAVIDATTTFPGPAYGHGFRSNLLIVGLDAVAVDAVGAALVGLDPAKMPILEEASRRGLGVADLEEIEVVGGSLSSLRAKIREGLKTVPKRRALAS